MPDRLILTTDGRYLLLELKKPGGRLSYHQEEWIRRLKDADHPVDVAYSLDDAKRIITDAFPDLSPP